jgi:hypothetical protein
MFFNSPKNNFFLFKDYFPPPKTKSYFPKYNPTFTQKPNPKPNIGLSQKNFLGFFGKFFENFHIFA